MSCSLGLAQTRPILARKHFVLLAPMKIVEFAQIDACLARPLPVAGSMKLRHCGGWKMWLASAPMGYYLKCHVSLRTDMAMASAVLVSLWMRRGTMVWEELLLQVEAYRRVDVSLGPQFTTFDK